MFLILDYKNVITEICNRAIYIKRLKNGFDDFATEADADSVYSDDTDSYYPAAKNPSSCNPYRIVEVEEVPENVEPLKFRYSVENGFVPLETLTTTDLSPEQALRQVGTILGSLLGGNENRLKDEELSLMLRRILQIFATEFVTEDAQALEVADIYPSWEELVAAQQTVPAKTIFKYRVDELGDTQLWRFVQDYIPTTLYTPDQDPTHYTKIGVTEEGYLEWKRPLGATDAYDIGDIVSHNGKLWICTQGDAAGKNTWEPGVYGWEEYTPETKEGDATE